MNNATRVVVVFVFLAFTRGAHIPSLCFMPENIISLVRHSRYTCETSVTDMRIPLRGVVKTLWVFFVLVPLTGE